MAVLAAGIVTIALVRQSGVADPTARSRTEPGAPAVQAMPAEQVVAPAVVQLVTYELTGRGPALNVTFVVQGSAIEQLREVTTPWSKLVPRRSTGPGTDYVTVSAQNAGDGELGCRIIVDGVVVSERTTVGRNGVVNCAKLIT
ncbi:MmpS family transport accessory protein [Amycolatopsis anabasis]|uniref:MmpS family transport accessory protein n=1 Tax=Amycolatopsis anabasis TaxID=1840409 RepID=UPI00131B8026|nr:MmpS family transport accessory protein [Amycolatopsis anabasis]